MVGLAVGIEKTTQSGGWPLVIMPILGIRKSYLPLQLPQLLQLRDCYRTSSALKTPTKIKHSISPLSTPPVFTAYYSLSLRTDSPSETSILSHVNGAYQGGHPTAQRDKRAWACALSSREDKLVLLDSGSFWVSFWSPLPGMLL